MKRVDIRTRKREPWSADEVLFLVSQNRNSIQFTCESNEWKQTIRVTNIETHWHTPLENDSSSIHMTNTVHRSRVHIQINPTQIYSQHNSIAVVRPGEPSQLWVHQITRWTSTCFFLLLSIKSTCKFPDSISWFPRSHYRVTLAVAHWLVRAGKSGTKMNCVCNVHQCAFSLCVCAVTVFVFIRSV